MYDLISGTRMLVYGVYPIAGFESLTPGKLLDNPFLLVTQQVILINVKFYDQRVLIAEGDLLKNCYI